MRAFAADIRAEGGKQGTVDGCVKVLRLVLGFALTLAPSSPTLLLA